jgi:tRNA threonylcarbamoyl adenosine modification protein (Sua5/YciO/YrdC/YwlC family)
MPTSPQVIRLDQIDDVRDAVHQAVQRLVEGHTVALPTETVYGVAAMALNEQAVCRLREIKGRPEQKPMALAVHSAGEALGYVPGMSKLGRRLASRCWPGPVTLVFHDGLDGGLAERLPPAVREAVVPTGSIGLRVSAHPLMLEVLRLMPGPLVLTSANRSGEPEAVSAQQVVDALDGAVELLLDDGPTRYGQPSTVVALEGDAWRILRSGVVPERTVRWMTGCYILFVCTGNTCRSPLAEGICRKLLAERAACDPYELGQHGWHVVSGGLAAIAGGRPTAEAVEVAAQRRVNLNDHISQPLSYQLVAQADYIFAMTQQHRDAITMQWPEVADRVELLAADGTDIPDPIGAGIDHYRQCADAIEKHLRHRLPQLEQ